MNKDTVVVRTKDVFAVEMDGVLGVLSPKAGNYYMFDEIGTDIWHRIESAIKLESLVEVLTVEYDVDFETCIKDILPLLDELQREGLIELV